MRIAVLQFSPALADVPANLRRATDLLSNSNPPLIADLLVLPELAFSGYNHRSAAAIRPYLEPTASGVSTEWAKATAAKYNCIVSIGYPERYTHEPQQLPTSNYNGPAPTPADPSPNDATTPAMVAYNSTVTVSPTGQILAHYRKTHLYYTDESWAQESPQGFFSTPLSLPLSSSASHTTAVVKPVTVAWGICMDLNPHRFTAPWTSYEFTTAAFWAGAEMLVVSMAWLTSMSEVEMAQGGADIPDTLTFAYWMERLQALIGGEKEVVVVFANRTGFEEGGKDPLGREGARYAGSSWIGVVGGGKVKVKEMLGRGQEGVLAVELGEGEGENEEWCWSYTPRMKAKDEEEEGGDGEKKEGV